MGYSRLSAGRTTLIVDTEAPPSGAASAQAHASTCAFELTSGRRPLIVNCGAGDSFGPTWRRAGRATPSHSVLGIEGFSSSRLSAESFVTGRSRELLVDTPKEVRVNREREVDGERIQVSHDGWRKTHGLTYARTLELTLDGRGIVGEELLTSLTPADERVFERAMDAAALQGVAYEIRFHLHPDVSPAIDLGGTAVSLALKSGEVWIFRQDGADQMRLEPSVYLERGRLKPRESQQILLTARAMTYASQVRWSLAKAQDTPLSVRDFRREEPLESEV